MMLYYVMLLEVGRVDRVGGQHLPVGFRGHPAITPNLPTKIIPAKMSLTRTFREIPCGPENSTP